MTTAPSEETRPATESWWRIEVGLDLDLANGRTASVRVSGSEHRLMDLSDNAAAQLGETVRKPLAREVAAARVDLLSGGPQGAAD